MRKEMRCMEERTKLKRYLAIVAIVLALGAVFVVWSGSAGADNWASWMSAAILVTMAVVAAIVAMKWSREMKAGFPKYDERSIAIRMRAGYLAFFVSLYFVFGMSLVISIIEDDDVLSIPTSELLMILVAVMGVIFLAINAYLNRKGVPE
jgi:drug/metabolite transporter (DMT)-like permease